MSTIITDNYGRTWKRATDPNLRAEGLWYSSAGTMSTLRELYAERGPLTVKGEPAKVINVCPCCANFIVNADECEHYPCHAGEPYKYIDITRTVTVVYSEWNDRTDISCDSCGVEAEHYGGLYKAVSRHYLES